ncbi:hypothetical protein NDU88_006841 [Pleurodeles waltl]|uniref:Uncharacterized protein n=1 Tax=Pleurodeles waltl TaxID=8319 RepID=A0AAV7PPN1_PLEWA|nr:hypothetical protein NDU88_006841 [Pleurodeles waltl]
MKRDPGESTSGGGPTGGLGRAAAAGEPRGTEPRWAAGGRGPKLGGGRPADTPCGRRWGRGPGIGVGPTSRPECKKGTPESARMAVGPADRGPRKGPGGQRRPAAASGGRGTPRGWASLGCRRPGQEERARPRIGRGPARRDNKWTPLEARLGARPRDRGEADFPAGSESTRESGDLWSGARSRGCDPADS